MEGVVIKCLACIAVLGSIKLVGLIPAEIDLIENNNNKKKKIKKKPIPNHRFVRLDWGNTCSLWEVVTQCLRGW